MYVGIDHSTTGMKIACFDGTHVVDTFKIDRRNLEQCNTVLDRLDERIGLSNITLATITYSYGNGIAEICDIEAVSNRGVRDLLGLGYETGAGATVFDQVQESSIPAVVLPGVHDDLDTLHPFFKHHSTWAGGDKVASMRCALERFQTLPSDGETFIWACASSSSMAGLVSEGQLKGFFHWIGPVHGWPDLEAIRDGMADGFDDILMQCGILPRLGRDLPDAHSIADEEILEHIYWALLLNISALAPFAENICGESPETILLSGRLTRHDHPVDIARRIYDQFIDTAPVSLLESFASARGAARIAHDVAAGADHVLGIPVGDVPSGVLSEKSSETPHIA